MNVAVILPAAGSGRRFHPSADPAAPPRSKIEFDLGGRPVFLRAIEVFLRRPAVGQIILAVHPDQVTDFKFRWGDKLAFHGVVVIGGGRAERWETVLRALDAVDPSCTHVAVHDAARPLASARLIDRLFEAAQRYPAVAPGLPVSDTLKRVEPVAPTDSDRDALEALLGGDARPAVKYHRILQTVDRANLVEIQTPQVFEVGLLRRAYAQITGGRCSGAGITDDAGLVEALGEPVYVVEGEVANFKITRPEDLALAAAYVKDIEQKQAAELARKRLFADDEQE